MLRSICPSSLLYYISDPLSDVISFLLKALDILLSVFDGDQILIAEGREFEISAPG